MCLGIPGEVVEILDRSPGPRHGRRQRRQAGDQHRPARRGRRCRGDWILIHVGFALSKIDESEAKAALEFLESIGQAYADEIAALHASAIE